MPRGSKKILIVAHYYPPHIGGIERVAWNQAKRLAAQGDEVTVVSSKVSSDEKSGMVDGVTIVRVPALNVLEKWGIPFPLFAPTLLPILLKHTKTADIVHVHDAFYISSFVAAIAARFYRKPVVLTQHVAMIDHPNMLVRAAQRIVYATTGSFIFNTSSKIITYNDRVDQFLIKKKVPHSRLLALPNGVDFNIFHPVSSEEKKKLKMELGLDLTKKIFLFVGRFVSKKGFDVLLAARGSKYQLVFAGGDMRQTNNTDAVFLGKFAPSELARVYQAADVFVLPSRGEGFPLSIQEAMASGLPIVTTNDYGYERYNLDKNMVRLIDDPDEARVRQAIESFLNNDRLLVDMGAYSEKYARENFDWTFITSKLREVYDSAILKPV
jgi:D-inositol-3-phosphate glycosyltransferase